MLVTCGLVARIVRPSCPVSEAVSAEQPEGAFSAGGTGHVRLRLTCVYGRPKAVFRTGCLDPPPATGGKAIRTRSSVETGKKRGPQGRAAKQGRKRKAGVVIKGN